MMTQRFYGDGRRAIEQQGLGTGDSAGMLLRQKNLLGANSVPA